MNNYKRNQRKQTAKASKILDDALGNMFGDMNRSEERSKQSAKSAKQSINDFIAGSTPAVNELTATDRRIRGVKNILEDPGSTEGEKESARKLLAKLEIKKIEEDSKC